MNETVERYKQRRQARLDEKIKAEAPVDKVQAYRDRRDARVKAKADGGPGSGKPKGYGGGGNFNNLSPREHLAKVEESFLEACDDFGENSPEYNKAWKNYLTGFERVATEAPHILDELDPHYSTMQSIYDGDDKEFIEGCISRYKDMVETLEKINHREAKEWRKEYTECCNEFKKNYN